MQGPSLMQFPSASMMSCRLKCPIGNLKAETSMEGLFRHLGADYNKWFRATHWVLWLNDPVIYALFVLISTYSRFPVVRLRLIWPRPKLSRTCPTPMVTAAAESVPSMWHFTVNVFNFFCHLPLKTPIFGLPQEQFKVKMVTDNELVFIAHAFFPQENLGGAISYETKTKTAFATAHRQSKPSQFHCHGMMLTMHAKVWLLA